MASVESQASSVKLSLEKYAGIVSVLNQGGDAASLVSDMSTLKEVAKLNGLEGRARNTKTDMLQMLCTSRLASPYIGMQYGACSTTGVYNEGCASTIPALLPSDLISLRWAVPSQALVNGISTAPTLLEFARGTIDRKQVSQVPLASSAAPVRQSVEQQVPLPLSSSTRQVRVGSTGQATRSCTVPGIAANGIQQHCEPAPISQLVVPSSSLGLSQTASLPVALQFPSHAHAQSQQDYTHLTMHPGAMNCEGSERLTSQSVFDMSAQYPRQQHAHNMPSSQVLDPTQQMPIAHTPSTISAPGGTVQGPITPRVQSPPAWLLQDIVEIARSSSVVPVRTGTCILKQRVAICFPEDQELSVPRKGPAIVRKGVYDGKVLEVLDHIQHDESVCPPGCRAKHVFCTVKLSVPDLKTRSQNIVEVCVDMPSHLQLGSFTAFALSEQVEDSWVLLSAGQSPEVAALSDMLDKTSQAKLPRQIASKKRLKNMSRTLVAKRPQPVLDLHKVNVSASKPKTLQPPPSVQHAPVLLSQKHALSQLQGQKFVPLTSTGQATVATPSMTQGLHSQAPSDDMAVPVMKQQAPAISTLTADARIVVSTAQELDATTACMDLTGAAGRVGIVEPVDGRRDILNSSNMSVTQQESSAAPEDNIERLPKQVQLPAVPVNPSQSKSGSGWKKRKRPVAEC